MNNIQNYRSLARRQGYERVPIRFQLCPSLQQKFDAYVAQTGFLWPQSEVTVPDLAPKHAGSEAFAKFYDHSFKPGTFFDHFGVAHEPGSERAFHMTKMYHPMENFDSVEQILAYPMPDYTCADATAQQQAVQDAHSRDLIAMGDMQMTVWETAWYMRGMENLMMDMGSDDPLAEVLLDRVTEQAVLRAESYARSGVDVLFLGDDIGMQNTILMSESLYKTWLQPRLAQVIRAAKAINPGILVFYHSCGYVLPMIPHLIEAGIDVLNPVQPECMDFAQVHSQYGDRISFHGTIGTQTTMPYGTPQEVRSAVFRNLDIAGEKGGLFVCPSHILEPEVPVANVVAYIQACMDYCG